MPMTDSIEYYISEYVGSGRDGNKYIPKVADGFWTSIDMRCADCSTSDGYAVVALPFRNDGPGREHLCSDHLDKATSISKCLASKFRLNICPGNLSSTMADLLICQAGPGRWNSLRAGMNNRYEIWLGNRMVWWMPSIAGGLIVRTDNFNRADEVPLVTGSSWESCIGRDLPDLVHDVDANNPCVRALKDVGTRHRAARWNPSQTTWPADHLSQIRNISLVSTVGATCRHQASSDTFYMFYYFAHNPEDLMTDLFMSKFVNGLETVLAGPFAQIESFPSIGGTVKCKVVGTTLTGYFKEDTMSFFLVFTVTDTAIAVAGSPGFDISSRPFSVAGGPLNQYADDFYAEAESPTVEPPSPTPPPVPPSGPCVSLAVVGVRRGR